jgi:cellulose synthase/poly-beta-1,6-N-acetylglucosamine synthase-like glycosyltransferase
MKLNKKKEVRRKRYVRKVSIITCTNRPNFINNIFQNYRRQVGIEKELIIVLNNDHMNIDQYRERAKKHRNVFIYQLPEKTSLGRCLNFAIGKSKHPFVAKFDDDDYYAPNYLVNSLKTLHHVKADVVGKGSYFMYLEGKKLLMLRRPKQENKFVKYIGGATIVAKRKVFNKVRFSNRTLSEDMKFLQDCRAKGFKIFSTDKYNYTAVRRKNPNTHTWKATNNGLLRQGKVIAHTNNFRPFVTRFTKK